MMCSPAQMAVEMAYLKLLDQISTWRRDGDKLSLGDDIGDVLASFTLAS
jgi:heat shock protein HslJ